MRGCKHTATQISAVSLDWISGHGVVSVDAPFKSKSEIIIFSKYNSFHTPLTCNFLQ